MKITLFGANGRVGRMVVAEALKRGYEVTVFVHTPGYFTESDTLHIVAGDIYNANEVASAISGSDVVLSALGSWGTQNKDILSAGMYAIIPAMRQMGIHRIISLTGSDARVSKDQLSFIHRIMHMLIRIGASKIIDDGEKHVQMLEQSGLDWTVIRSPIMNNSGTPLSYTLTTMRPQPWATINRQSVADALLGAVESDAHIQSAPYITRTR